MICIHVNCCFTILTIRESVIERTKRIRELGACIETTLVLFKNYVQTLFIKCISTESLILQLRRHFPHKLAYNTI